MKQTHLICIDIDGTLTVSPDGDVPLDNREAVLRTRNAGHKVLVNTGRAFGNLPPKLLEDNIFDGWICAGGSYIRMGERVLRNKTIPHPLLDALVDYCVEKDDRFCLFEGESTLLKVRDYSDLYGSPGTRIWSADDLHARFPGVEINILSCEGHLPPAFHARFGRMLNIFQCDTFADCTPLGCDKADGMAFAAAHFGIPMEHTVAIGDSANDLPMLEKAGTSVAVGNAPERIRRAADFVTGANTESGVAQILHQLFLS